MGARYTTNVNIAGRVDGGRLAHRVRLTATATGDLVFAEHYVGGELKGCGPSLVCLPRVVREQCEDRLASAPAASPLLWRALSESLSGQVSR